MAEDAVAATQPGRALDDARQQLAATSEILTALGRSGSDPEAVLGTIVDSAHRLCRADQAQLYLVDGDRYRLARSSGLSDEARAFIDEHPLVLDRASLVGRVGLDRRAQQIEDVLADPDYGRRDLQRVGGFRTTVGAPMLLDDEVVGVLLLWRSEVSPFDDASLAVLTTFAAQAAIALRQVQLVRELETRGAELARRVAELEALNEVGDAVSSSLDLDEVLATVVAMAVELSGTEGGSMFEYDEAERLFMLRTAHGTEPELLDRLRHTRIGLDESMVGRAAVEGRTLQFPDLDAVELDAHLSTSARRSGGGRYSPSRCCGSRWWSARWSYGGAAPAGSSRRSASCWRRSPASRRWRCSTPGCSASSAPSAPSSRW